MEEFLENLLYSATFPAMDQWRRFSAAPEPPESVMRIFVRMEMRLQHRYGLIALERLAERATLRVELGTLASGILDLRRLILKHRLN